MYKYVYICMGSQNQIAFLWHFSGKIKLEFMESRHPIINVAPPRWGARNAHSPEITQQPLNNHNHRSDFIFSAKWPLLGWAISKNTFAKIFSLYRKFLCRWWKVVGGGRGSGKSFEKYSIAPGLVACNVRHLLATSGHYSCHIWYDSSA